MSLFGRIRDGLELKAADISALTYQRLLNDIPSKAGVPVSLSTALKVSTVLACARVLANGIAQTPLKLLRQMPGGGKIEATDHPLFRVLHRRPNDWQTSFDFRHVMMMHAVLAGNAYAFVGRGGRPARVVELIPLLPERVTVEQSSDYEVTYAVSDGAGGRTSVPARNILHLRGPSWNGYAGLDAVATAREAIGLAIATEEAQARLHANGARPGGLLSVEGRLSDSAKQQLRASLQQRVEGINNAFRTLVLDQQAKWTPFAMTGVDAQHLETRKFQIEEICRDLGVFPQMVGYADKTATFASAEAFFQAHVTHSLMPWAENWQQTIAVSLLGPEDGDLYAEFTLQALLRGDHQARAAFYKAGIVDGWMTRNEARALENLNPLPGLDAPLIPLNMTGGGAS